MINILELLELTEARIPDKCAFSDEKSELTFSELKHNARAVGSFLAGRITPCSPVALYLEKSTVAICGMMGAVYARGAYSVLDIRQPANRIQSILNILEPEIILTDRQNEAKAKELGFHADIFCIEDLISTAADCELLASIRSTAQDIDPLYINFTSGSTGIPKGVTVCHRSVIDFIGYFTDIFGITENDVIGNQAPFDFDVSVKDIYSGLAVGAKVQIIPRDYFSQPTILMDYLDEKKITTLTWAVSAMCFVSIMNGLAYRVPSAVSKVLFSGEVLPIKHLNIWRKYLPDAMYVNLYGPTEITCNCTYYILDREYELTDVLPIGRPFPNEKVFLLDENDRLVHEVGVQGELCVSGTALALGYYKDPVRTNQAFVQNPINNCYNELIYRTGDIAKYDEDGNLIYVSRKDFQIKHLGHRIELGEIEAAASALDDITRVCCLYDGDKKRILMYYTGGRTKADLMAELRGLLPAFMLPNSITALDEMPITKNGKIDRSKLKELGGNRK